MRGVARRPCATEPIPPSRRRRDNARRASGAAEYARSKIGELGRLTHRPVLYARVKLTRHRDPAVERPVVAQANLDVDGRLVRVQVEGVTAREAIDRLEARLRHRLERTAEHWEALRGRAPAAVSARVAAPVRADASTRLLPPAGG